MGDAQKEEAPAKDDGEDKGEDVEETKDPIKEWKENGGIFIKHPLVTGIAKKHNVSSAQVMIRWVHQYGAIVIPKSTSKNRIVENAAAFASGYGEGKGFKLDQDDMDALAKLDHPSNRLYNDPTEMP